MHSWRIQTSLMLMYWTHPQTRGHLRNLYHKADLHPAAPFMNSMVSACSNMKILYLCFSTKILIGRYHKKILCHITGEMGILVAGGCDDSCHEHLDDTLFFSFATQSWQTLPAKVKISNCSFHSIMIYMSIF